MALPESVQFKFFRAVSHFKELETELQRYFETNPGKVVRQPEGEPNQFIGRFEATNPIPGRLPIIMGDCIQNLRSCLDYLVWELVLAAKGTPGKNNSFPICKMLEAFNNQVTKLRRLDGVAPDAVAEIKVFQPYHHGQDFAKHVLWILDDLCNINKHRRVLLTRLVGGMVDHLETKTVDGVLLANLNISRVKQKIGPFPIVDAVHGPGVQVDVNPQILAYVAFNEGATQDMDVGLVLNELMRFVNSVVFPRFERFFN
jgi:hypothetical protein